MRIVSQQAEFLKDVVLLLIEADRQGFIVTGGELYRTQYQQDFYLRTGASQRKESIHQKRMAIDLNFFVKNTEGILELTYNKEIIQPLGDYWCRLCPQNEWGGNWIVLVDTPHFQRTPL
jgi:hypothetical protein